MDMFSIPILNKVGFLEVTPTQESRGSLSMDSRGGSHGS